MVPNGQGVVAYGVLYRWFLDVSGLGLAEQARMLMHPAPPKREEELAKHVEMWQDKMRRLEAHGDEFKLAPIFEIRPGNSYEELLTKVKDYSRRRQLDSSAKVQRSAEEIPLTQEPSAHGVGAKTLAENATKEIVRMPSASRAEAKANAKEIVKIAGRPDTTQGNAPTS